MTKVMGLEEWAYVSVCVVRGDGEVEIPDAVAAVFRSQVDGVVAGVVEAVALIEVVGQCTLADSDCVVKDVCRINNEMQMDDAVAAGSRGEIQIVDARFVVGEKFVVFPKERHPIVTYTDSGVDRVGRQNRKRDGSGAVAVVDVQTVVHQSVNPSFSKHGVESVLIECGSLTNRCLVCHNGSWIHLQRKSRSAVATVNV